ncbi:respiratory nitrate reductase subunit gamma [Nocardiopsis xinjiangensis]|uniref:respiratory nitrate reductase subunit gamma n=1 Tax=Nocardiopsis xinjiangensis TaxID=124285 RepID=UPI00034811E9|nr:respiratory nitrate reductase subunit gamma [Nocardiopsis xinjiangensis]
MSTTLETVLWVIAPYACMAVFLVGHYWRYRYDKFGWTTLSTQIYESRLLRWGSPLFHFGMLAVIGGHVIGLLIPKGWTAAAGITDEGYHVMAVGLGLVAGTAVAVGLTLLIMRRRLVGPVFRATSRMDKLMYVGLALVILTGMANTVVGNVIGHYDYREGVSIWFRGLFFLDPHPELMGAAPITFQAHVLASLALFALWPFTRLVHVFSVPIGHLWRPYVPYRSRDTRMGERRGRRGWENAEDGSRTP